VPLGLSPRRRIGPSSGWSVDLDVKRACRSCAFASWALRLDCTCAERKRALALEGVRLNVESYRVNVLLKVLSEPSNLNGKCSVFSFPVAARSRCSIRV
jgi:hypothetical protein